MPWHATLFLSFITTTEFLVPLTGIELVTFALRMRSSKYIEAFKNIAPTYKVHIFQ